MSTKKRNGRTNGPHQPAARSSTATIADHVMDWMANNNPSWSIDMLLTHPYEAIEMANDVNVLLRRERNAANVHEVCRIALNHRKHGGVRRDAK